MGATIEVGDKYLLLFDGVCNLCNGAVNFIIDRDERQMFVFASLQSSLGQDILRKHHLSESDFKSMILVKDKRIYLKSDAVLEIAKYLPGGWRLLYGFKIIPKFLRDWAYEIIAANRYRWFGKEDQCRIPTPEIKKRFVST